MNTLRYLGLAILTLSLYASCQNISTKACSLPYHLSTITPSDTLSIPVLDKSFDCIEIKSRSKTYDVIAINLEVKDTAWMQQNHERLVQFAFNYAHDIRQANLASNQLEAVVVNIKNSLSDVKSIKQFEFSEKELSAEK